jgi:single-stranded DNA-binding protein
MLNTCAIVGHLERDPHVRLQAESGHQVVSFTVRVEEPGKDGRAFSTFIPVECYGRCATHAETLSKDVCMAVEGQLGWKSDEKHGEKRSTLMVVARQISVLTPVEVSA